MKKFIKTSDKLFSGPGIQLKYIVRNDMEYYNEIENSVYVKEKSM